MLLLTGERKLIQGETCYLRGMPFLGFDMTSQILKFVQMLALLEFEQTQDM